MTQSDILELERLISAVKRAQEKRDKKESHEASLLEFMCAESRLVTWMRANADGLLDCIKRCEQLESQAACQHAGWERCQDCDWGP